MLLLKTPGRTLENLAKHLPWWHLSWSRLIHHDVLLFPTKAPERSLHYESRSESPGLLIFLGLSLLGFSRLSHQLTAKHNRGLPATSTPKVNRTNLDEVRPRQPAATPTETTRTRKRSAPSAIPTRGHSNQKATVTRSHTNWKVTPNYKFRPEREILGLAVKPAPRVRAAGEAAGQSVEVALG